MTDSPCAGVALLAGMRSLLPYAGVGILLMVGVTVLTAVTDGNAAAVIGRRANRTFARTLFMRRALLAVVLILPLFAIPVAAQNKKKPAPPDPRRWLLL